MNAGDALAASIFFHVLSYVPVTLLGLYYLKRIGYTLTELHAAAASVKEKSLPAPLPRNAISGARTRKNDLPARSHKRE